MSRQDQESTDTLQIIVAGLLVLFTVSAAALLHTNQPEFLLGRFPSISPLEYAFFDAVLYLSYLLLGIVSGILSDRIAKRKSFVVLGGLGSSIFYWLMTTTLNYSLLLGFRFAQGAFTVLAWQTLMTLVLDNSIASNRGRNMGIFGVFLATAMGLGPVLGGILGEIGVFYPYYAGSVLSLLVGIIALIGIREPTHLTIQPSIRQSLSLLRRTPELGVPSIVNFVDRLHMGFILTALPLLLVQVLGVSESLRGMALGLFATPFILLQYPVGKLSDRVGRFKLIIIGSFSYGLILAMLGAISQLGLAALIATLMLLGAFSGLTAPPTLAWVGDVTDPQDTATGMGIFNLMGNLGMVVGPLILGFVLLSNGFVLAFFIAGAIEFTALVAVLVEYRRSGKIADRHLKADKAADVLE